MMHKISFLRPSPDSSLAFQERISSRNIRLSARLTVLLVLTSLSATPLLAGGPPKDAGLKLTWSDDFNGNKLDQTKWEYRTDSKLLSTQTPGNVAVNGGYLTIALRKEEVSGKAYSGGGVISRKAFHYGYYEARLKIEAGSGWHSSFWMMGYNGKDTLGQAATLEMDAIENKSDDLHSYGVNTHRWAISHIAAGHKDVQTPDLSKDFHVFGCEYAPDVVRYYFDGKLVQTVDWHGQPQGDVNIWLTSIAEAMGPAHGVDDAALPGKMLVDWVRFYSK
ncbi:MAG TPA: glycoside hydrolase family 16 protein [Edaphobacter sp.]|nr:glycoside hydrolase family 16 protein [Edaphobacter sp.]